MRRPAVRRPFRETPAGERFVKTAASRETSPEIMEAIAYFARDLREAESLWNGDGLGVLAWDIWERVTGNGKRWEGDYVWGAAGDQWAKGFVNTPLPLRPPDQ
jgi:hypothetical protein